MRRGDEERAQLGVNDDREKPMVAGFDPVRDAAAVGSPTDPFQPTPRSSVPSTSAATASAAEHKRRATDLSVLLNASPLGSPQSPLFTPHRPAAVERDYFPPTVAAHSFVEPLRPPPPPQVSTVTGASVRKPVSRSSLHDLLSPTNVEPVLPFRRASGSSDRGGESPSRPASRSSVHDLCAPVTAPPVSAAIFAFGQNLPPTFATTTNSSRPGIFTPERSPELSRPSTASSLFLPSPRATASPLPAPASTSTGVISARTSPVASTRPLPALSLPAKPIPGPSSTVIALPSTSAHVQPSPAHSAQTTAPMKHIAPTPPRPADRAAPPVRNVHAIPYAPKRRLGPPNPSLFQPLSRAEASALHDPIQRRGWQRLARKGSHAVGAGVKRPPSASSVPDAPPVKRSKDVSLIAGHYNARPEVGKTARQTSPIIGLKNFNNWVKSVLILRFAHPALAASPGGKGPRARQGDVLRTNGGKVLDMGCGKGGDLQKWSRAPVKEYVGVDIAAVSVDQARARWQDQKTPRFDAEFAALDCYTHPLTAALTPARLAKPFDVVSMQFCMHYAFETLAKARQMLDNVARWLRPGGVFVGTIPNAEFLLSQLDAIPSDVDELEFGNSVYKIRFEERASKRQFGHRYWFFLRDAVDDVPEYVVHWDTFVGMAAEYGLKPIYKRGFHQFFEEHQEHKDYGPLMIRMNVVDAQGESQMDEDQWDAANVYLAFAFEKQAQLR